MSEVEGTSMHFRFCLIVSVFILLPRLALRAIFSKVKVCMTRRIDSSVMYASSSAEAEGQ
jgi:hypothetical protein